MTLTDKDAQRRPWCIFSRPIAGFTTIPTRLVYVDLKEPDCYWDENGKKWPRCRECTPEELAPTGLTQPPKPWADRVTQWAIDRNIIGGTTPKDQFGKLEEEVEELRDAIYSDNIREIVDAIGDCAVVLTIIAAQYGLTLEQCQEAAWEEIKDRKGRIINGAFVKEASE
jgi:NTP pyrophosphatase (non-canonical NTP hydrolase)